MSYITPEGRQRFAEELKTLWKEERPEWTRRVSAAAAEGDRSENAEYIYGKKKLREIDRRIRFLTKLLEDCTVVDKVPEDQSKIYFGAWVTVENTEGSIETFRIVGEHESDYKNRKISLESPVAKALMKKAIGDTIDVKTPTERRHLKVVKIRYT